MAAMTPAPALRVPPDLTSLESSEVARMSEARPLRTARGPEGARRRRINEHSATLRLDVDSGLRGPGPRGEAAAAVPSLHRPGRGRGRLGAARGRTRDQRRTVAAVRVARGRGGKD